MSTETKKPEAKKAAPKKQMEAGLKKKAEEVKAEMDAKLKPKAEETEKPDSIRPARGAKAIQTEEVMKKWEDLVDILNRYLAQQRKANKAWRHINQAYFVIKQHMLRFKRNLPG